MYLHCAYTVIFCLTLVALLSGVTGNDHDHHSDPDHHSHPEPEMLKANVVYQWNIVEYEWPSTSARQAAIDSGSYIPTNSAINGIKLYKNRVFVTVPRLKNGVPSTLNEVVENTDTSMTSESHVLRPYPTWEMQTLGNCSSLQRVQSMEIDPSTGHMWIVDTGYVSKMEDVTVQPLDACPAKIIVWDINTNMEIRRYHFPVSTIGVGLFYLNDVVLEVHNGAARYAYMSGTLDYKLAGYVPKMEDVTVQPLDACPAKIIVWDINTNMEIRRYHFPISTIGVGLFYLNDVVLEVHNGAARYAYMSDTLDYKLVVYDFLKDESFAYSHPNMRNEKQYENITISNITLTGIITGINGIAMSPDFKYVYYSSVAGVGLHQIETGVLKEARGNDKAFAASVRTLGNKISPGDGMAYGAEDNLYFSSLGSKSVYKWDIKKDMASGFGFHDVQLHSQSPLVTDPRMEWIDTLAIDGCGYLWFTTSRLHKFFSQEGVVQHEPNFYVWKVFVDDYNYLDPHRRRGGDVISEGGRGVSGIGVVTVVSVGLLVMLTGRLV